METAAHHRVSLLLFGVLAYALVTAAFIVGERPGLGLAYFYFIPILLVAFAGNGLAGAVAGFAGAALYSGAIIVNPDLPSHLRPAETLIRLVSFVGIGWLVGLFANRNRELVAELSHLANRDSVTGLPNTRAFQNAIDARLAAGEPFVLLVGDVDELRQINVSGREAGDDALRRLADRLVAAKRGDDDVARVGGDEFAILAALESAGDGRSRAISIEDRLNLGGDRVTFGWATYPQDGDNALALYRAADERLYARKVARGVPQRTVT